MSVIDKSPSRQQSMLTIYSTKRSSSSRDDCPSYSQLQIILESVQKIKVQAQAQIESLKKANQQLLEQKKFLQKVAKGGQYKQQQFQNLKQCIEQNYLIQLKQNKSMIDALHGEKQQLQLSNMKQHTKIQQLEHNLEQSALMYQMEKNNNRQYREILNQLGIRQMHEGIQLSSKIKNKFTSIQYLLSEDQNKDQKITCQQDRIFSLQRQLAQFKAELKEKNRLIQTLTLQVHSLQQIIDLNISSSKEAQKIFLNDKKCFEQKIHEKDVQIAECRQQIKLLQGRLLQQRQHHQSQRQKLESQINRIKIQHEKKWDLFIHDKDQMEYNQLVDTICEQNKLQDQQRIAERLLYLQKYRSQYYYNVQKIQYLCKMLDI